MSAPTPGPGWREVPNLVDVPEGAETLTWAPPAPAGVRSWVLIPPKPLPTDAGTMIRVLDGDAEGDWICDGPGWHRSGDRGSVPAEVLADRIGSFTTIAAPPAVTAAAVLADVRAAPNGATVDLDPIAQQYGATLPQA